MSARPKSRLVAITTLWPQATYDRITAEAERLQISPGDYIVKNFTARRARRAQTDPEELIRFFALLRKAMANGDASLIPGHAHCVGINRSNRLLLFPAEAIEAARAAAEAEGVPFTGTATSLGKLMLARRLLIQTDKSAQALRRVDGDLRRVWSLPPHAFWQR